MEFNGILIITKTPTNKIEVKIQYKDPSGRDTYLTVPKIYSQYIRDTSLHNKPIQFTKNKNGQVDKIIVDGKDFFDYLNVPSVSQQAQTTSTSSQAKPQNPNIPTNQNNVDISLNLMPRDTRSLGIRQIDNYILRTHKSGRYKMGEKKDGNIKIDKYNFDLFQYSHYDFRSVSFDKIIKRYANSIQNCFPIHHIFQAENDWRMAVGLGHESIFEVSMTLHPIHGFPYIPATTIKGITRSWIIENIFDRSELKALQDEGFSLIFGSPDSLREDGKEYKTKLGDHRGSVVFLDGYPTKPPKIARDIMNPHYSKYYAGPNKNNNKIEPPGDYYSPVPVSFLSVEKGTFQFALGAYRDIKIESGKFQGASVFSIAKDWLKKALTEKGIGAKTSIGYGFFIT